jgi:hypothetical protein
MHTIKDTMRTKFHDDQFRHSSDINVSTPTILEAAMLVLLMGGFMN